MGENKDDTNETINVRSNEEFTIVLDSNPTTGYRWEARFESPAISLVRRGFEPEKKWIGGGGREKFVFAVHGSGEVKLKMIYKRPWEKRPVKTKSFTVKIN